MDSGNWLYKSLAAGLLFNSISIVWLLVVVNFIILVCVEVDDDVVSVVVFTLVLAAVLSWVGYTWALQAVREKVINNKLSSRKIFFMIITFCMFIFYLIYIKYVIKYNLLFEDLESFFVNS